MKFFIVLSVVVAAALAAPAGPTGPEADAQILQYASDNIGTGNANYNFETSNGIKANEETVLEGAGTPDEAIFVRGQFSYPGPDGVIYSVVYTAGRNGFQPQAPHIPVA